MVTNCCYNCQDRHAGCHVECLKYKEFRTVHMAKKELVYKKRQIEIDRDRWTIGVRRRRG